MSPIKTMSPILKEMMAALEKRLQTAIAMLDAANEHAEATLRGYEALNEQIRREAEEESSVAGAPSVEEVTRVVNGEAFSQSAGPQVGIPDTQSVPSSITEDDSRVGVHGLSPAGALSEEVPSEK